MSDYANLRDAYYQLLTAETDPPADIMATIDQDRERWKNRNPTPPVDMALLKARTQADWHLAQQVLLDSESPDLERAKMEAEMSGEKPTKIMGEGQKPDLTQAQRHREQAKKRLEEMRRGEFRDTAGIGASGRQPASTPGYVPAPVQGQTPPVPGRQQSQTPTHEESHRQTAEAHRQASQIHQDAAGRQPADRLRHEDAAEMHRRQAEFHEQDSRGSPNAPEARLQGEDRPQPTQQPAGQPQPGQQPGQQQEQERQRQEEERRHQEEERKRREEEQSRNNKNHKAK